MALIGNFTKKIYSGNLVASAVVPDAYMRLADARVINKYERLGEPPVTQKKVIASGRLDVYAASTDIADGIEPITSAEYSCNHTNGAVVELEIYAYIMSLPEFAGCAAG